MALAPVLQEVWDFPAATPESQGVDSAKLRARLDACVKAKYQLDSVLILKNGYLISENYFGENTADTPHFLASCTKSVLSALTGIAIAEGKIKGPEQKASDFYPGADSEITIAQLLTMTSGIDGDEDWDVWANAEDIGRALLEHELLAPPGTKYHYGNGVELLANLLAKAVGQPLQDYAREKLFEPMDIRNYSWSTNANGTAFGGFGLEMTPRDMLKFGYLYLQNGRWKDRQLLPAQWVRDSAPWSAEPSRYGRLFWNNSFDGSVYEARGAYGQYISIFTAQNAVVVVTAQEEINHHENLYKNLAQDLSKMQRLAPGDSGT
jgi:CubicO group peptidase (beta-lactamase class C family)